MDLRCQKLTELQTSPKEKARKIVGRRKMDLHGNRITQRKDAVKWTLYYEDQNLVDRF